MTDTNWTWTFMVGLDPDRAYPQARLNKLRRIGFPEAAIREDGTLDMAAAEAEGWRIVDGALVGPPEAHWIGGRWEDA